MAARKVIAHGERVPVKLSEAERTLIQEETFVGDDLLTPLQAAGAARGHVTVMLSLDDVEELEGFVAASANHCDDRKLETRLDRIFEKLHDVLERYDEAEPGEQPNKPMQRTAFRRR